MADVLIGYHDFTSRKDNKSYTVAHVVKEPTPNEKQNGYVGEKVENVFMPDDMVGKLKPSDIGKSIEFEYHISGYRAYLVGVRLLDKK